MSRLYFMPFRPAYDSAGISVPGAQHYFTAGGVPTAPFEDEALTTPHSNPVVADGAGKLPPIYMDDALTYRVRIYDRNAEAGVDTPLEDYNPFIPGSVVLSELNLGDVTGAPTAGSRILLAAIDHAVASTVILTESSREGTFVFDTSDLSAEVTADTAQGVYVAPSSDTTGASGAWVRKFDGDVLGSWFGISSASADNYAAIGAALAVARLVKRQLRLPDGTLTINQASPNFALADDDRITGMGRGRTTIYCTGLSGAGELFTATSKSRVRISDMRIESSVLMTTGWVATSFYDCVDCLVEDVTFNNWTNSVIFWTAGGGAATGPVPPQATNLRNKAINCISLNSRSYAFFMNFATACEFLNCEAYNVTNQDGFKFGGGTMFAKVIGCHAEGCNADGFDTYDGFIASVMADCTSYNNTSNGFQFKGTLNGTYSAGDYVTRQSTFSNLVARGNALAGFLFQEMRNASVVGLVASENGTSGIILNNIQGVNFSACSTFRNTQHGWNLIGGTSKCTFSGCGAMDNSWAGGTVQNGTYDGFNLNTSSNCYFTGCYSSNGTLAGKLGGQGYAFNTTTSAGNFFNGCAAGTSVTGAVGGTTPYANNKFTAFDAAGTFIPSNQSVGYPSGLGIGGNVTQATSKTTGVILNALTGYIIMQAGALAAGATAEFTVTNSLINQRDTIHLNLAAGAASGSAYQYWVSGVATGSFKITLLNRSAGSLSEGVIFNFAVVKATNT